MVVGGLAPLAELALRAALGALGAEPVGFVLNRLGLVALVFLVLGLACTPARWLFAVTWPARLTRALGLLGFGYATLHLLAYALVDQGLDLAAVWKELKEKPFVSVGLQAWLLLVPLAWTSSSSWVRRLGYPRWKRLHRMAYAAAGLGVLHFFLRVKKDATEPLVYALVLVTLLALRFVNRLITR